MPSTKDIERQLSGLAGSQLDWAKRLFGEFEAGLKTGQEMEQPYADLLSAIIYGDRDQLTRLLSGQISEATRQRQQARENIYRSIPAGAGREYALATLEREMPSEFASWQRQAWASAYPQLAEMGRARMDYAANMLDKAMSAQERGASQLYNLLRLAASRKQSTLGTLGALAQFAGSAVFRLPGLLGKGTKGG